MSEDESKPEKTIVTAQVKRSELNDFVSEHQSKSAKVRELIENYNTIKGELELEDELEVINVSVLKSYQNVIEKHIQLLESEKQKIEERLSKYETEEDDAGEVLIKIDLDLVTENL